MASQELDYGRFVALEAENQALRQHVANLTQLLHYRDAEIRSARQRIQLLEPFAIHAQEASMRQAATEQASRTLLLDPPVTESIVFPLDSSGTNSSGPYDREKLLRLGAVMGKQGGQVESEEQSRLMCKRMEEDLGATTPTSKSKQSKASKASAGRQQTETIVGNGISDVQAEVPLATSPLTSPTQNSPGKRSPPPLDLCGMLEDPTADASNQTPSACVDGDMDSTPNKRLPIVDPDTMKQIPDAPPATTPSKRLQITDPKTGKAIEVTPNTESSRMKPTLISLDSIVEGRAGPPAHSPPSASPLSPTGPTAPPLTLPPVVAGAPPLATVPMRPPPPLPAQYAGLPVHASPPPGSPPLPLGSPLLGLQALHGLGPPPPSPGWPPPGVPPLGLPGMLPPPAVLGGGMPHCPPPSHPAPTPAGTHPSTSSTSAPSPSTAPSSSEFRVEASSSTAPVPTERSEPDKTASVAERLADTLGGGLGLARHLSEPLGGPMQLARGPLAGVPILPGENALGEPPPLGSTTVGVGAVGEAVGTSPPIEGPPPPPTGPALLPHSATSSTAPSLLGTMPVGPPPPVHLSTLPPPHGLPPQGFPLGQPPLQGPLLSPAPGMLPPGALPPLGLAPGGPLLGGLPMPGSGALPTAGLLGFAGYPNGPPPAIGMLPTAGPPPVGQAPGLRAVPGDMHPGVNLAPPSLPPGMPPSPPP